MSFPRSQVNEIFRSLPSSMDERFSKSTVPLLHAAETARTRKTEGGGNGEMKCMVSFYRSSTAMMKDRRIESFSYLPNGLTCFGF